MRILIAEDDPATRRILTSRLSKWGYELVVTGDGKKAWEVLQAEDGPRLAILDWMMPGLDGAELCRRVRASADRPYVYIILLTALQREEDIVRGMEAGADDYVSKPFHPDELRVRLRAGKRILDLETELTATIATLRSERAKLEAAQQTLVQQQKLAGIGVLAAGIAHEISNPMSIVTSYVRELARELPTLPERPSAMREYVEDVLPAALDGIARVNRIVADLRGFAEGGLEAMEELDLNCEVEAALRLARGHLGERCAVEPFLEKVPPITGCRHEIERVVVNLLLNAAESMERRGVVRLATRAREGGAELEVADRGMGMAPETLAHLFEPFFTTKPPGRGVGLGLSVVHQIVDRHGGRILVDSHPGKGSTFTVWLPRSAAG